MAPVLPKDFKEFLKSLNSNAVDYLLIGGYAVSIYGYVRATNALDVWIRVNPENAHRVESALREFGFGGAGLSAALFQEPDAVIRMGVPPLRVEILTSISGVDFEACYAEKTVIEADGILIPVISLKRLRDNKAASGRAKDLADLEGLPEV